MNLKVIKIFKTGKSSNKFNVINYDHSDYWMRILSFGELLVLSQRQEILFSLARDVCSNILAIKSNFFSEFKRFISKLWFFNPNYTRL